MKHKTPRSSDYMAYVREHESLLWTDGKPSNAGYQVADIVAHHVRMDGDGGMGLKPSDYRTVPLHATEHRDLHDMGEKEFWEIYKIDPREAMIAMLVPYIKDRKALFQALELLAVRQDDGQ